MQPTATNTEHVNVFFSVPFSCPSLTPFQIPLVLQAFGNKGAAWLGKEQMPLLLWDRHMLLMARQAPEDTCAPVHS